MIVVGSKSGVLAFTQEGLNETLELIEVTKSSNERNAVGIITKADLINKGTEGRIALLAKNQDTTKLKLGYFLLKNPTPAQLDLSGDQVDEI